MSVRATMRKPWKPPALPRSERRKTAQLVYLLGFNGAIEGTAAPSQPLELPFPPAERKASRRARRWTYGALIASVVGAAVALALGAA